MLGLGAGLGRRLVLGLASLGRRWSADAVGSKRRSRLPRRSAPVAGPGRVVTEGFADVVAKVTPLL